jgi:hypothetical protein
MISVHNVARRRARSGLSVSGRASSAASITSTFSASTCPMALKNPRLLASAAATRRSVSPSSRASRAASRRVSRNEAMPA